MMKVAFVRSAPHRRQYVLFQSNRTCIDNFVGTTRTVKRPTCTYLSKEQQQQHHQPLLVPSSSTGSNNNGVGYDSRPSYTSTQQLLNRYNNTNKINKISTLSMSLSKPSLDTGSLQQHARQFSLSSSSSSTVRVGLGSQKWSTINKSSYQEIVYEALRTGITTIEAGQEGGDELLASILRPYLEQLQLSTTTTTVTKPPLQVLIRIGYRVINTDTTSGSTSRKELFPQDVQLTQQDLQSSTSSSINNNDNKNGTDLSSSSTILHNIHPTYIDHIVKTSACIKLSQDYPDYVNVVFVLHNPEEQGMIKTTNDGMIKTRLIASFIKLQQLVVSKTISGFGICSNGICLPKDHPLHLSWNNTIVPATQEAATAVAGSTNSTTSSKLAFNVLQFPCNVMETSALSEFAKDIKQKQQQQQQENDSLFQNLQLYAIRPLSCYPDRGTGTGNPFLLIDYKLPATMDKVLTWSNEMTTVPELYNVAYMTAIQHFDATDILDKQAQAVATGQILDDVLTVEERETLDGCKLLQSLLHDLDLALQQVRSVQQYEVDLITKIVPLIRDTFDSYDDDTAAVLQSYFGAYGIAVKYSVATNIRQLVQQQGEHNNNVMKPPTITSAPGSVQQQFSSTQSPSDLEQVRKEVIQLLVQSKRLQEFAIEYVLNKRFEQHDTDNNNNNNNTNTTTFLVDKVIVGCTEPWQVQDIVDISKRIQ